MLKPKHHDMNVMRAQWAKAALATFTKETFAGDEPDTMHPEDRDDAIGDLICDLLHYQNQNSSTGTTAADLHSRAFNHYTHELENPDS